MTILPMTGRVYTDDFIRFADEVVLTIKVGYFWMRLKYKADARAFVQSGAAVFFSRMPIHFIEEAGNLGLIKNRIILADFDGEVNGMPIVNGQGLSYLACDVFLTRSSSSRKRVRDG